MGRGQNSGGKRSKDAPDWLKPAEERDAGVTMAPAPEESKKKRARDDEDDEKPGKKGIKVRCVRQPYRLTCGMICSVLAPSQMGPLIFLVMMVLPGLAPIVIQVYDRYESPAHAGPSATAFA